MSGLGPRVFCGTLAALALAGCQTVGNERFSWGQLAAACEKDRATPPWREPQPQIDNLLVLGTVKDPAITGGVLTPSEPDSGYGGATAWTWMERTGQNEVDVWMRPTTSLPDAHNSFEFGPYLGEPEGVYRWARLPLSDPRCPPYLTWHSAWVEHSKAVFGPQWNPAPLKACLAYTFSGGADLTSYQYIYVDWWDTALRGTGAARKIQELRRGPHDVVAHSVYYVATGDILQAAPGCFHLSKGVESWFAKP
jgi:hypothetical protein